MISPAGSNSQYNEQLSSLIEACRKAGVGNIDDLNNTVQSIGASTNVFDIALTHPDYPRASLDIWIPGIHKPSRLFVHETFDRAEQEDGEALLLQAGLGFFPAIAEIDPLIFREVPPSTQRFLSHANSHRRAVLMSSLFIAPTLKKLFAREGVVPSSVSMGNLAHSEEVASDNGNDKLMAKVVFLPPYQFEPVSSSDFVEAAISNTRTYGDLVAEYLRIDLTN